MWGFLRRWKGGLLLGLLGLMLGGLAVPSAVAWADNGPHGNYTPTTDACATCHRTHTAPASRLLMNTVPGLCFSCHGAAGAGADTNVEDGLYLERDPWAETPAEGAPGVGLKAGGFVNAWMDVNEDGVPEVGAVTSGHDGAPQAMAWGNGGLNMGPGKGNFSLTCTTCHDPHGGGAYRSLRPIPTGSGAGVEVVVPDENPKEYTVSDTNGNYFGQYYDLNLAFALTDWCSQCHTRYDAPAGSGHTDSGDGIFAFRHPTEQVPCVKCHVAHGTVATMSSVAGTPVLFPDGSAAPSDNARSSLLRLSDRRVCYSCHVNSSGTIEAATCTQCHDQPRGSRRQIVGAGVDFSLRSHHVNGAVMDTDCTVCHDTSYHTAGTVRLFNVDTGAVISFTGQGAGLETFCLSCHDGDGAAGNAPFSDGVMPPVIDATAWANASHNTAPNGPQTCYGACHQNGHGSNLANLLAPWTGSPGPGNTNEEEGFCYTCHDADGPASIDIQSQFAQTSYHNVDANDPGGEYLECTNCHNPHLANAANKLADPDTGAQTPWTGTMEAFCLTCHDGSPPGGVAFPASASGTGYDKSTFVGTTHDTQTGGTDSCRQCHDQHGSPYNSLLLNDYVTADYNPYTYPDADYALCWNCHDEWQTIFGQSRFGKYKNGVFDENFHDKHVRGEQAPCFVCHDVHAPHDAGEPGLINFDFAVQLGYDIQYIGGRDGSTAFWINGNQGYCYIRCHGKDHTPKQYQRAP